MSAVVEHDAAEKRALRREVRARISAIPAEVRSAASAAITARLLALPAYRTARAIHCFISLPVEVDTAPVLLDAHRTGKRVYVPVQIPTTSRLGLALWEPELSLTAGPLGVMEPAVDQRLDHAAEPIDLVVVPGLAFDRRGTRLGRGKGYYDRFLSELLAAARGRSHSPLLLSLAFACQMVPAVPRDPWDVPVEHILTEDEAFLTFQR